MWDWGLMEVSYTCFVVPSSVLREYDAWCNRVKPKKVIINDPATVMFFNDGSKVVAKAGHGDEYDPLFGIMDCALRKVGRNRVSTHLWEVVIKFLADYLADAKECRLIADMLNMTADAIELDGVMDAMEEYDASAFEDCTDAHACGTRPTTTTTYAVAFATEAERDSDLISRHERTRQTIRNLVDSGEL